LQTRRQLRARILTSLTDTTFNSYDEIKQRCNNNDKIKHVPRISNIRGNSCSLRVALLNKKPIAMILIKHSTVNNIVKQLSRYPANTIPGASGFYNGVSIASIIELIMIKVIIMPSKIFASVALPAGGAFFEYV
jgi:hypothetical protein